MSDTYANLPEKKPGIFKISRTKRSQARDTDVSKFEAETTNSAKKVLGDPEVIETGSLPAELKVAEYLLFSQSRPP